MKLKDFIKREPLNSGRQIEVDLVKAFIAFNLAAIHVFVECSPDSVLDVFSIPYIFDSILGGPLAAPMFMFSMGIGVIYSRNSTPKKLFIRGLKLLGIGLLLNVCRYLLPSLLGYLITHDSAFYLERLPFLFFGNDILQFAGLAAILLALLFYLKTPGIVIVLLAVAMNVAASLIGDVDTGNTVLNVILGHFVGVGQEGTVFSDFPLLIWFMIFTGGMVFGQFIRRLINRQRFYAIVTLPAIILPSLYFYYEWNEGFGMMGGEGANVFYHMQCYEAILCIILAIGSIGLGYFICRLFSEPVNTLITRISRALTCIYFIQWTIVWWVVDFLIYIIRGTRYFGWEYALPLGLALGCISTYLGIWWKEKGKERFLRILLEKKYE